MEVETPYLDLELEEYSSCVLHAFKSASENAHFFDDYEQSQF